MPSIPFTETTVNAASVALMAVVMIQPARTALVDYRAIAIAIGAEAAVLLLRYNATMTRLVPEGTITSIVIRTAAFDRWLGS
jgi:hypothetical protein